MVQPCCCIKSAATLESTPPLMAIIALRAIFFASLLSAFILTRSCDRYTCRPRPWLPPSKGSPHRPGRTQHAVPVRSVFYSAGKTVCPGRDKTSVSQCCVPYQINSCRLDVTASAAMAAVEPTKSAHSATHGTHSGYAGNSASGHAAPCRFRSLLFAGDSSCPQFRIKKPGSPRMMAPALVCQGSILERLRKVGKISSICSVPIDRRMVLGYIP